MNTLHAIAAALAVAWAYFCAHIAPVLAVTILPTYITGLSNKPGASTRKAVKVLQLLLRGCSVAVHCNEPGSVKMPFVDLLWLLGKGLVQLYRIFKPAAPALLIGVLIACTSCAQYSACVKASATAAFKQDSAANVERQVSGMLTIAASAEWVQFGLQAAEDACFDTACTSLFYCAISAWQQAHPATPAASAKVMNAHLGIKAYVAKKPGAAALMRQCQTRFAVLTPVDPEWSACMPGISSTAPTCEQEPPLAPARGPEIGTLLVVDSDDSALARTRFLRTSSGSAAVSVH
jgi:hypothetical protein